MVVIMGRDEHSLIIYEVDNALDSLLVAKNFIELSNEYKWKWCTIALHDCLYALAISALVNGNYDNVIEGRFVDGGTIVKWGDDEIGEIQKVKTYPNRHYYRIEYDVPNSNSGMDVKNKKSKNDKLIGFWTALARVMDGGYWMKRMISHKPLVLSDDELEEIHFVKELRNDFVHYIPSVKVHSVEQIKRGLKVVVKSIDFLLNESNTIITVRDYSKYGSINVNEVIHVIKGNLE